ncbi:MAG: hypothetical protein JO004_05235, partial [Methylobacteriaceae bacterium]|nr:hypothetical protein [Methylobacteriaceae bacterium]
MAPIWRMMTIGLVAVVGTLAAASSSRAQAPRLITQAVNDSVLVTTTGNTRPEANAANDRGIVPDGFAMPHLLMQLRRSDAQEQALMALIDQVHDPKSPNFHHWLSPSEVGAQFGPAAADIQTVSDWLAQQGFTVNLVYPNKMVVDFSGTAGQVRTAFHTEIHTLSVNGVDHFANMSDPQIPAALAPAIVGVVGLNNFRPRPGAAPNPVKPDFTRGGNYYMSPPDLATIYNFNPVFATGNTGQSQTIYFVEDSNLYQDADWSTFRNGFGIPVSNYPSASLSTIHPAPASGPNNCTDPGVNSDDGEATLDAEYASAAAPGAAIVMVTCTSLLIAMQNLIQGGSAPTIISMSYIDSEPNNGATTNAAWYSIFQTGAINGISIFVCAGDQGAASTDYQTTARHGITVNGYASTPFNVAVGGTDFGDTYAGTTTTYWNSINTGRGSAKSYIPEIPWNTTCGSQLFATSQMFSTTYGASGFCNSASIDSFYLLDWAGSGGPSACATGAPTVAGVVSGTCAGWPKPPWQSVVGVPNDGVRDLPDVSLFASFGPWNHSYVFC